MRLTNKALAIIGMTVALLSGMAVASATTNTNAVDYWCDNGAKYEPVATPFVVPQPQDGTLWTLLVLKSGSGEGENATWVNPTAGAGYSHPSGKENSHAILCWEDPPITTTTTSAVTTTVANSSTTTVTVPPSTTTTTGPKTQTTVTSSSTTTTVIPTTVTTSPTTTVPAVTTTTPTDTTTTVPTTSSSLPSSTVTTSTAPTGSSTTTTMTELPNTGPEDLPIPLALALVGIGVLALLLSSWVGRRSGSSSG